MRICITYYPPVNTSEEFADIVSRAAWYFYSVLSQINEIRVYAYTELVWPSTVPEGFDPLIVDRLKALQTIAVVK